MKTVGFVHSGSKASFIRHLAALHTGLGVMGAKRDVDYTIVERWAEDNSQRLEDQIKELVDDDDVTVIVAAGGPQPAQIAKRATAGAVRRKPVVFTTVADPRGNGLVGDNLTGMAGKTSERDDDRLVLLAQLLQDRIKNVHCLFRKGRPGLPAHKHHLRNVAGGLGLDFSDREVGDDADLDNAFAGMPRVDALLVTADAFFNNRRKRMVELAAGLPAVYQWREFVESGGLMSYGPNIMEAYVFAGAYAARILRNESPADIPISEPTYYETVINGATASRLGIEISASLISDACATARKLSIELPAWNGVELIS